MDTVIAIASVQAWVEQYLTAWRTNAAADIEALFTEDAEYHETPYETHWVGRPAIVDGWRSRWGWQQGGWTFEWALTSAGPPVVVEGVGSYRELGRFRNVWTLDLADDGRCRRFAMVNEEIA